MVVYRNEVGATSREVANAEGWKYYTYGAHTFAPIFSTETGAVVCVGRDLCEEEEDVYDNE